MSVVQCGLQNQFTTRNCCRFWRLPLQSSAISRTSGAHLRSPCDVWLEEQLDPKRVHDVLPAKSALHQAVALPLLLDVSLVSLLNVFGGGL